MFDTIALSLQTEKMTCKAICRSKVSEGLNIISAKVLIAYPRVFVIVKLVMVTFSLDATSLQI